jgi:hypothetical protein
MKTLIGVGALFASSLFVASDAKAGIFDRGCRCPCPPAATASVQGTTSYSATYQPGDSGSQRAVRRSTRSKSWEDYRRDVKGW